MTNRLPAPPGRGRRFGLRSRVSAAFAAAGAALSLALAVTTYALVHHYLLARAENSAVTSTYSNALVVKRDLANSASNVGEVLSSLSNEQGTAVLMYQGGKWYSASVAVGDTGRALPPAGLPPALIRMVSSGTPARQRVTVQGQPAVAVGVPLAEVGGDYFEIYSLSELARTLDLIAGVLLGCALATTLGGLLIGRWASGRVVRPLARITEVAAAIATGALDQRLPPADDPDLAVLARSFNEMVDALEQRMRRDARFASDVSHELRSPLTTVQASLELLRGSERNLPPEGQKALELLSAEIGRFSAMVQDLLEMSRFDAGAANLDLEEVALDDLVVNTVATYTGDAVWVSVLPDAKDLWTLCDRRRLQRVLVNLLDNAGAHAGGALCVRVERRGDEAVIMVDDAGPGVRPAERKAIFERFYRGAAAGRRGGTSGTGLGLALVAEHIKAHQGGVEVTDRPGGGARFIVCIPAIPRNGVPVLPSRQRAQAVPE
ncbi:MAG TPA: HAMP domain-containing sensor histidine kinase [Acidimicrobiales bacterium]|nr:HAMP domain-containing sensor histidine kinase [Acidimicrobiales bacterium]